MARSVILGNGSLTVGLDENGLVNDFYYPYVGLDNLNTARSMHHAIGVYVDHEFSWVADEGWVSSVKFGPDALISQTRFRNEHLGITIVSIDFVDSEVNAFCRRLTVHNERNDTREIRVFLHQVFEISRAGRADTALYVPEENYLLDYKGRCSLLIYGVDGNGKSFDQYSVGNYGIEGKEGTYKDAEDGELTGNAVEHGGVDSVIRFSQEIPADDEYIIDYWIVAADSQFSAAALHNKIKQHGLKHRLEKTRRYWEEWISIGTENLPEDILPRYSDAIKKSLLVIKSHTDKRGGIIASCDSSIYNYGRDYYSYVWPRDGAYAIWPLIKLGYRNEPRQFFEFCRDILTSDGYFMHKYQPDKAIGSTWHPLIHGKKSELAIQEDETAVVIYMLREYVRETSDTEFALGLYGTLIQPAAHFMSQFIDEHTRLPHATYDLWEEKFLTSTYTTAVTYQSLLAAAEFAQMFDYPDDAVRWSDAAKIIKSGANVFYDSELKRLRKGFLLLENGSLDFDNVLDVSSLFAAWKFALYKDDDEFILDTTKAIETSLSDKSPIGGTPRYEDDNYFASEPKYLGNPWFVTSLWMAQYYAYANRKNDTQGLIDWTLDKALASGVLSEQIDPTTGKPLSVTPLVWSHAELINAILDLYKK